MSDKNFFDNALFTYYVANKENNDLGLSERCCVSGWHVFASSATKVSISENYDGDSVVVIGYCIDSHGELNADEIAKYLAGLDDAEFFVQLARFAGKYVIFKVDADGVFAYTDATASLPAFYGQKDELTCISSNEYFVHKIIGADEDERILKILKKADGAKTLPGNMSHYDGVYALLPNNYYSSLDNKSVRYNLYEPPLHLSAKDAADKASKLIKNVVACIAGDFEIKCPLTGGYDSRVILAVLNNVKYNLSEIYTMRHQNTLDSDDLAIPSKIASDYGINHAILEDKQASDELRFVADSVFGKEFYSERTLDIVSTLKDYIGIGCILNGDIVGQIGKSSLHRSIPEVFMGPRYYRCKIHNTSKYALSETKKMV